MVSVVTPFRSNRRLGSQKKWKKFLDGRSRASVVGRGAEHRFGFQAGDGVGWLTNGGTSCTLNPKRCCAPHSKGCVACPCMQNGHLTGGLVCSTFKRKVLIAAVPEGGGFQA
jgi:hypothetical protein